MFNIQRSASVLQCYSATATNKGRRASRAGFSLVELLVVVVIIGILSVVSYVAIQRTRTRSMNDRMLDDLVAIGNALEDYRREHNGKFPDPVDLGLENQNILCFYPDATYADCGDTAVAFRQGMVDNTLLSKAYLREVPTDPRTGSRYVYGVDKTGKFYQVAGLYEEDDGDFTARSVQNLGKGFELPSLIRAYDGPNFVVDGEDNLPYSPRNELVGTLAHVSGTVKIDGQDAQDNDVVNSGQTVTTDLGSSVDLYFTDGSVTHLSQGTTLVLKSLSTEQNDKSGTITKILLHLKLGKIWSKVVRLADKSEFRVETTGAIAGVRGTEFGEDCSIEGDACKTEVKSGTVWIQPVEQPNPDTGAELDVAMDESFKESATALDNTLHAPTPDHLAANYGLIPLSNNLRPHLLSATETGGSVILSVRDIDHLAQSVPGVASRRHDATWLAAYSGDTRIITIDLSTPAPYILRLTSIHGGTVLRFEKVGTCGEQNTECILARSGDTPVPALTAGGSMAEPELYPNLMPLAPIEGGEPTLSAPSTVAFDSVAASSSSFTATFGGAFKSYVLIATGKPASVCGQNMTGSETQTTQTVVIGEVGDCELTAEFTLADGSKRTLPKTVQVVAKSDQITMHDPTFTTVSNVTHAILSWGPPSPPTGASYTLKYWIVGSSPTEIPRSTSPSKIIVNPGKTYRWNVYLIKDGSTLQLAAGTEDGFTVIDPGALSANFSISPPLSVNPSTGVDEFSLEGTAGMDFILSAYPVVTDDTVAYSWTGATPYAGAAGTAKVTVSGLQPGQTKTLSVTLRASKGAATASSTRTWTVKAGYPGIEEIKFVDPAPTAGTPPEPTLLPKPQALPIAGSGGAQFEFGWDKCTISTTAGGTVDTTGNYTPSSSSTAANDILTCTVAAGAVLKDTFGNVYVAGPTALAATLEIKLPAVVVTPTLALNDSQAYHKAGDQISLTFSDATPGFYPRLLAAPSGSASVVGDIVASSLTPDVPGIYKIGLSNGTDTEGTPLEIKACGYVGAGNECWVKGAVGTASVPGESCADACSTKGLTCVEADWNDCGANGVCGPTAPDEDDCSICRFLIGNNSANCNYLDGSGYFYAPITFSGKCRYRLNASQNCNEKTAAPYMSSSRICRCN